MQSTYPLFTALPLAAAFFNLLVTKINKKAADYIAFLAVGTLAVLAVLTAFEQPFAYRVGGFPAPWGILLVSDGLSSLMLIIVNVIAFLSVIYSIKYMTTYTAKPKYFFLERYMDSFIAELHEFVEAVRQDKQPPVTGKDGRVPVVMAMAATRSACEGRPVKLSEIEG